MWMFLVSILCLNFMYGIHCTCVTQLSIRLSHWVCNRKSCGFNHAEQVHVTALDTFYAHTCLYHQALECGTSISWEAKSGCDGMALRQGHFNSSIAKEQKMSTSSLF